MLTVKQFELNLKRTNDKIVRVTKELSDLKETKIKIIAAIKKAKGISPKKTKRKKQIKIMLPKIL